jgi:hypothetical protein
MPSLQHLKLYNFQFNCCALISTTKQRFAHAASVGSTFSMGLDWCYGFPGMIAKSFEDFELQLQMPGPTYLPRPFGMPEICNQPGGDFERGLRRCEDCVPRISNSRTNRRCNTEPSFLTSMYLSYEVIYQTSYSASSKAPRGSLTAISLINYCCLFPWL